MSRSAKQGKERRGVNGYSRVIRRLFAERPALTAGELLEVLEPYKCKGAGRKHGKRR